MRWGLLINRQGLRVNPEMNKEPRRDAGLFTVPAQLYSEETEALPCSRWLQLWVELMERHSSGRVASSSARSPAPLAGRSKEESMSTASIYLHLKVRWNWLIWLQSLQLKAVCSLSAKRLRAKKTSVIWPCRLWWTWQTRGRRRRAEWL